MPTHTVVRLKAVAPQASPDEATREMRLIKRFPSGSQITYVLRWQYDSIACLVEALVHMHVSTNGEFTVDDAITIANHNGLFAVRLVTKRLLGNALVAA